VTTKAQATEAKIDTVDIKLKRSCRIKETINTMQRRKYLQTKDSIRG
jgi:hypothetical protein